MVEVPQGLFPVSQESADAAFDWVFAPWIKDMGLTDFVVREGFVSMRLPYNEKLAFFSGSICGQAIMAAIDTAASMAVATGHRFARGTAYQHTHFLRPAAGDDLMITATVRRFGTTSAYVDCQVAFAGTGKLVSHGVLEFAY
ncbi:PaaI family thioesterase [Tsuneonella sp. YG55]|uniref:PaaI family thioesterase n=1 Tax=Tsuneonella litorea TaxID=2976475 RepID=A0A9X3A794_9SPHN|nr:PaaI family thioesterase [Tsuneonella litorea]MCT2558136.1 PaaI family thioesterase [Tsuneonella litorea]